MPGQSPPPSADSDVGEIAGAAESASRPSAATIAGSASGSANSRRISARPGNAGWRDSARATKIAGTTDSSVDSAACHSVKQATRTR